MSQVRFRDLIEDNWQKLLSMKAQLRDLQTEENRRLREETSERWKRKLQDKAKEKARIEENKAKSSKDNNNKEKEKDKDRGSLSNDSSSVLNGLIKESASEYTKSHEDIKQAEESNKKRQEFLKKEKHLLDEIHQLQSKCSMCPLGRDRYYRRYWIFKSLPGLFVENDNGQLAAELNTLIKFEPIDSAVAHMDTTANEINTGGINNTSNLNLDVKVNFKNESDCSNSSSNNENMNGKENNPKLDKEINGVQTATAIGLSSKFNNKSFNSKRTIFEAIFKYKSPNIIH
jgi:hypothetical protein